MLTLQAMKSIKRTFEKAAIASEKSASFYVNDSSAKRFNLIRVPSTDK